MMTKDERIRFYKSKEWQTTRKRVLERDNYECQQCKRDGKLTTYDKSKHKSLDVDHILSLQHHPEFAHDLNNLETLCIKCHNKKEKRFIKKNKWKDEKW
ncbi:HNH endonuclease [Staphylococcus aureus]|nr:HNH endonuclease [Staphylococcus aureus]